MGDELSFIQGVLVRVEGPLSFRFLLQPAIAIFFAVRDARKDAREGKTPYNWAVLSGSKNWRERLMSGWKSVGKVFIVAICMDFIFQYVVSRSSGLSEYLGSRAFDPVGALQAGLILAVVPYLLIRGPLSRLLRR